MNILKQNLIVLIFVIFSFCMLRNVMCENETVGVEDEKIEKSESNMINKESSAVTSTENEDAEMKKLIDELAKQKEKLGKLESKLQETSKMNKQIEDIETEKNKKREVVSKNIEENKKNKGSSASGKGIVPSSLEENVPENKKVSEGGEGGIIQPPLEKELENKVVVEDKVNEGKDEIIIKEMDKIINPFELAESLYKVEEYETALDIYKLIKKEDQVNEKESWISYQIANCYRKLKLYDEAMKVYKQILVDFEGTYWAKQAQWYIENIEWRMGVKDELEMVGEK